MGIGLHITLIISMLFFISAGIVDVTSEKIIIQDNCYDQKYHKINDLTCDKQVFKYKSKGTLYNLFLSFGFLSFFLIPLILMALDSILDRREEDSS